MEVRKRNTRVSQRPSPDKNTEKTGKMTYADDVVAVVRKNKESGVTKKKKSFPHAAQKEF